MHYAKYGKTAAFKILQHSDRGIDSPDTHEHSNENIDKSKTHLNYDLKDREGLTAYQYHKQMIDKIADDTKERTGKAIRKDAVTLCSWAVTVPKDLDEDKHEEFFKKTYVFFKERYGENNIVTAVVHHDETTPHLHFQFVPIIENDGVRKLCAKDMETPKTLRNIHKDLQDFLENELNCSVMLLNGATINGNKTIQELQAEELKAENERLKAQYDKMTKTLSDKEMKKIDTTPKRLTGGFKGLSPTQAQELVNTSMALRRENKSLRDENKQLKEKNKVLQNDNSAVSSELKQIKQERQATFSREKLERERKQQERLERSERERGKLENYMSQLKFSDGTTALEDFERLEKAKKQKNRGWER